MTTTPEVARLEALRDRIRPCRDTQSCCFSYVDDALAEARAAPSPDGEIEALVREIGGDIEIRYAPILGKENMPGDVWVTRIPCGRMTSPADNAVFADQLVAALRALRDKLAPPEPELPDYDAKLDVELCLLLPEDARSVARAMLKASPRARASLIAYCREHKLGAKGGAL